MFLFINNSCKSFVFVYNFRIFVVYKSLQKNLMSQFNINQRFEFLNQLTTLVVDGVSPSLILVGEGGLGKTHSVMSVVSSNLYEAEWVVFKGYSTARGLYNSLFDNNGKVIIFDDCDSILEDRVAVNILKSALDSYDKRTITWNSRMSRSDEYPQQFNFTGRIIFISNKSMDSIDGAVLTRSLTVDLAMTPDEKIERMSHILPQILSDYEECVRIDSLLFLKEKKDKIDLNFRSLITTAKIRNSYPENWRDLANYMISTK
jgi:hypothetical protein